MKCFYFMMLGVFLCLSTSFAAPIRADDDDAFSERWIRNVYANCELVQKLDSPSRPEIIKPFCECYTKKFLYYIQYYMVRHSDKLLGKNREQFFKSAKIQEALQVIADVSGGECIADLSSKVEELLIDTDSYVEDVLGIK